MIAAAALLLTGAGCGLISINGKPLGSKTNSPPPNSTSPGTTTPTTAKSSPAPEPVGDPAPGTDAGLLSLYRSLDYTCCTKDALRARGYSGVDAAWVFSDAGISIKAARGPNPDPERFPGWDTADTRTRAHAVLQAAIDRTWTAKCHEDFDAYWGAWKALEQEVRPRLDEAAKGANHYEDVEQVRALWTLVDERVQAEKLDLPAKHASQWGGLRFELLHTYFDLHRARPSMAELTDSSTLDNFRARGHQWGDEQLERDQYCFHARFYGTPTTPPRPSAGSFEASLLLPPSWGQREAELEQRLSAAAKTASEALHHERADSNRIALQMIDPKVGSTVYVGGAENGDDVLYVVEAVERKGTKTTIRAGHEKHSKHRHNCRRTNRVQRIRGDGSVEYEEICTFTPYVIEYDVTLAFDDLPAGRVRKGDEISAFATLTKSKPSAMGGRKKRYVHRFAANGTHLDRVVRGGKLVHRH